MGSSDDVQGDIAKKFVLLDPAVARRRPLEDEVLETEERPLRLDLVTGRGVSSIESREDVEGRWTGVRRILGAGLG